jgi:hypothetical protein
MALPRLGLVNVAYTLVCAASTLMSTPGASRSRPLSQIKQAQPRQPRLL